MYKKVLAVLATVGVIAVAVVALVSSDNAGSSSRSVSPTSVSGGAAPVPGMTAGVSREIFQFNELATMVATSTLVVDASVAQTEPGVSSGTDHAQESYTNAALSINDVLYGEPPAGPVVVEELTESAEQPIQLDGLEHLDVGDAGIFFLRPAVHNDNYVLTNSQGRYLADENGNLRGAKKKDALIERLSMRTRAELKGDIKDAKKAINAGKVKAKPYPAGAPEPNTEP